MRIQISDDRPRLEIEMADGAMALLSPLGPDDRALLRQGLDLLSIESRYNRFGQGVGLTDSEIDYLAFVDQQDHVAWGVAVDGEGAGVGRYILSEWPGCAEIAVTVLDEYQRRGLGRLLFDALVAVARHDGVEEFCFEVLADNEAVNRMIRGIDVHLDESESVLIGRVSLDDITVGPFDDELVEVIERAREELGG